MSISFACSQCGKTYCVKDEMAGKAAKCGCGNQLLVPRPRSITPTSESSLFDDLASYEKTAATARAPGSPHLSSRAPLAAPASPAKPTSFDRGANIRRNLRRWWKILVALTAGWFLLTLVVCVSAISYAHANHLSQQRIQLLGQGCGTVMVILLAVMWLTILLIANRARPR